MAGRWEVRFERSFDKEFARFAEDVQVELIAHAELLAAYGPDLGRPYADRLKGSAFHNMKELRFEADGGVWRIAFAFDQQSRAVLLVAGDKAGLWDKAEERFYRRLIATADARFEAYLDRAARPLAPRGKGAKG